MPKKFYQVILSLVKICIAKTVLYLRG